MFCEIVSATVYPIRFADDSGVLNFGMLLLNYHSWWTGMTYSPVLVIVDSLALVLS